MLGVLVLLVSLTACNGAPAPENPPGTTTSHPTMERNYTVAEMAAEGTPDAQSDAGYPAPIVVDDPSTTNDESNDQPSGSVGTVTLCAHSNDSGHTYPLDADIEDGTVTTIYFPKGGNVDFSDCQLDGDLQGDCDDDEGRGWTFSGEC